MNLEENVFALLFNIVLSPVFFSHRSQALSEFFKNTKEDTKYVVMNRENLQTLNQFLNSNSINPVIFREKKHTEVFTLPKHIDLF